jgi:hypothetical protein
MVEYANANGYGQYIVRINGDMVIPEGEELVISKNSYLVVLNGGSLVLDGTVFNQGTMRLFGADMSIGLNGWLSNEGLF